MPEKAAAHAGLSREHLIQTKLLPVFKEESKKCKK
jgi:hypothetical protein